MHTISTTIPTRSFIPPAHSKEQIRNVAAPLNRWCIAHHADCINRPLVWILFRLAPLSFGSAALLRRTRLRTGRVVGRSRWCGLFHTCSSCRCRICRRCRGGRPYANNEASLVRRVVCVRRGRRGHVLFRHCTTSRETLRRCLSQNHLIPHVVQTVFIDNIHQHLGERVTKVLIAIHLVIARTQRWVCQAVDEIALMMCGQPINVVNRNFHLVTGTNALWDELVFLFEDVRVKSYGCNELVGVVAGFAWDDFPLLRWCRRRG